MIAGGLIQNGLTVQALGVTLYFSIPLVILFTLLTGAFVGWINGIIITKFGVAPFIATLGTMYIARSQYYIESGCCFFGVKDKVRFAFFSWLV
jgi:erythritol transport system permease protein